MLYREDVERREAWLAPGACRAAESKGRDVYEEPCKFRTEFQRERPNYSLQGFSQTDA